MVQRDQHRNYGLNESGVVVVVEHNDAHRRPKLLLFLRSCFAMRHALLSLPHSHINGRTCLSLFPSQLLHYLPAHSGQCFLSIYLHRCIHQLSNFFSMQPSLSGLIPRFDNGRGVAIVTATPHTAIAHMCAAWRHDASHPHGPSLCTCLVVATSLDSHVI